MERESNAAEAIRYASIVSAFLPPIVYSILIRRMPKQNHIIGVMTIVFIVFEFIALYQFNHRYSTILLSNIYFAVFFLVGCWFYYEVFFKQHSTSYFYLGLAMYFIVFATITTNVRGIFEYQSELWAISGFILVVFGILYTNYLTDKPPVLDKNLYSALFISGGMFLYFSFNFFLFAIGNYMLTEVDREISRMTWAFHNVNNIIKNFAFALGFYYTNRRKIAITEAEREILEGHHLR